MEKGLKIKDKKILKLITTFVEVTEEKRLGGTFCFPSRE